MQHPLHQHPLQRTDSRPLYPDYDGYWKCDNCGSNYDPSSQPFHCFPCSFDLCESCVKGQQFRNHPHPLHLTNMSTIYPDGRWKCDVCGLLNDKLPPIYQVNAYHCFQPGCEYDVCQVCFQASHPHTFIQIGRQNISPDLVCSVCYGRDQIRSAFVLFCKECRYSICEVCLDQYFISKHPHPLYLTDCRALYPESSGRWNCDICGRIGSPDNPTLNRPYHCKTCDFDVCIECMERDKATRNLPGGVDIPGPPKEAFISNHFTIGLASDRPGPAGHLGSRLTNVSMNFRPCDEDQSA